MPFLDNDGVTRLTTDYLDVFARKEDAILDPSGGLTRTDGGISVDSLIRESDGAISGSIVELTAEGHAEQFSTTGKNLLPNNAPSQTVNGVTFTVNADGTITTSGTATAQIVVSVGTTDSLAAGTYSISGAAGGGLSIYELQSGYNGNTYRDQGNGVSITLNEAAQLPVSIVVRNGANMNGKLISPQLELGSTATEYEPYTGGAPSPSPDYPQEIQVVRGRNLLDESKSVNGIIESGGNINSNDNCSVSDYIEVTPNTDYYMTNGIGTSSRRSAAVYSSSKTFLRQVALSGSGQKSGVLNTGDNAAYIRVAYYNVSSGIYQPPQLELGSTPTPYVPYGHVGMEVQGKNLLDTRTYYYLINGTVSYGDHAITLSKVNSGSSAMVEYHVEGLTIGSAYTFSVASAIPTDAIVYAINQARNRTYVYFTNDSKATFTATETTCWIRLQVKDNSQVSSVAFEGLQLELGSTATEYEPYYHSTTSIPLPSRGWVAGLPDGTADSLRIDGAGKVEWEEKTAEGVYTSCIKAIGTRVKLTALGTAKPFNNYTIPIVMSSHFTAYKAGNLESSNVNGVTINDLGEIAIKVLGVTGDTDYDTWLSTHPVTVLYPLATPVTEEAGYVDMPSIPVDCTVSIPELDALGVKYFVDNSAGTLARQWYERADDESDASIDQRIELVESNIAMIESTTAQSNHAVNSYFMLDNVLRKATSAIASGETISNSNSSPITVEQVVTALNNSVAALEKEVVFAITPSVSHRNIYRGKNLGTALTTAQKAQIAAGTFEDLYVGDYWTINGRVYRIADINYYYNSGDTAFTKNHLVIVPDASFGSDKMNDTNDTTGAYKGSKIYIDTSSVLNTARATIANDFGSALATHRIYLQNATTNGYASAGEWTDSTVDLMNEPMVYGSYIYTPAGNGSISPNRITVEKSQLALFRLNHRMINPGRYGYWLQDVVTGAGFAVADSGGNAGYLNASASRGVRPSFCIVGD